MAIEASRGHRRPRSMAVVRGAERVAAVLLLVGDEHVLRAELRRARNPGPRRYGVDADPGNTWKSWPRVDLRRRTTVWSSVAVPSHWPATSVRPRVSRSRRSLNAWTARRRPSRPTSNAPRGALLYPRRSRDELEGRFVGLMAYPDPRGERNNRMPVKRRPAQVSGPGCRGTRVIWRKLDCLKPNLQKTQRPVRRKGTRDRRHALRRHRRKVAATFGAWSVAQ